MENPFLNILNALSLYSHRGQAAIFLTLEYTNLGLGRVFPTTHFLPYEDDYYRMVESILYKEGDDKLSLFVSLMRMDLETLIEPLLKAFTKTGKIRKNSKYTPEELMSYAMMMDVLSRILKRFHTMPEVEINQLLEDYTQEEGGMIYFNAIEKLSDDIAMDMMGNMMQFVEGSSM